MYDERWSECITVLIIQIGIQDANNSRGVPLEYVLTYYTNHPHIWGYHCMKSKMGITRKYTVHNIHHSS